MSVITLEGVVEKGQIKLKSDIQLPENTKVYVVVPGLQVEKTSHIYSPRLADPKRIADFQMEIAEDAIDADL